MQYLPEAFSAGEQAGLLAEIRKIVGLAPLFVPRMPRSGTPMSVRMTNAGPLGWVTDKAGGYRYEPTHPESGHPWPEIPESLLKLWTRLADYPHPPEACLINYYGGAAKMGLHQDRDEEDFTAPVISISLGDTAVFRVGATTLKGPTRKLELRSGDVVVLAGADRLAYHGIDRVLPGTSQLLEEGGRFNLTLRRVTKPGWPVG